jgi:hypothetical protein
MGAKTGFDDEVEDVIIQVLGHKERRNILKMLSGRAPVFSNRHASWGEMFWIFQRS